MASGSAGTIQFTAPNVSTTLTFSVTATGSRLPLSSVFGLTSAPGPRGGTAARCALSCHWGIVVRTLSDLGLTSAVVTDRSLSRLAQGLVGSEVLRIAGEVRAAIAAGRTICNLTVGDFDPREFPLPAKLVADIKGALDAGHSNYPPSNGIPELRKAVVEFYARELALEYPVDSVVIAAGARPLIYATYKTLVDAGDTVVFPVPSWNNNHYIYMTGAKGVPLEVTRENQFHPTAEQIAAVLPQARLLALSSPLNPTGTTMRPEVLERICRMVVDENARRARTGEGPRTLGLLGERFTADIRNESCQALGAEFGLRDQRRRAFAARPAIMAS